MFVVAVIEDNKRVCSDDILCTCLVGFTTYQRNNTCMAREYIEHCTTHQWECGMGDSFPSFNGTRE